tara:strand:- start:915 stop:1073 length:159 start_codon:yes stop_codon:yes gene_type:complete
MIERLSSILQDQGREEKHRKVKMEREGESDRGSDRESDRKKCERVIETDGRE